MNNFKELGDFDFMLLHEHKLKERDIAFVHQRMGFHGIWSPVENTAMGGLAILIGHRYVDKILDTGVDKENTFLGVKVATHAGVVGIVNTYALHKPHERARIWQRMHQVLEPGIAWMVAGDLNFVERQKDKKGGPCFVVREDESWFLLKDMYLGLGDP